jgi:2-polyprenyl-3-methyl-5-hydroxy-6-metoxy-1,4-benzoquinol methylase
MFNIVKCNNCGLIYLNPRPTAESISKLYEADYAPEEVVNASLITKRPNWKVTVKGMLYKLYGYIGDLPRKGRILELGCGEGAILEILSKRGCEVWGIEPNPKAAWICKKKGLNVICSALEEANFRNEFFDAVIMSQVVEHLPSPKGTLKEINRIVKCKGKVYIYCPNVESYLSRLFGKYWHGWHIPFHFYSFTKETILKLINEVGFKVAKIDTITPPHFFTTSLKSFLWGESNNILPPIKRGKALDNPLVKISLLPVFRTLDFVLRDRGDCLRIELVK